MQVIDKPKQSILPFSIRKKVMTQQSLSKVQTYRITPARKHKLKLKLKKLEEYKRPKFMCYQLGGIDNGTRKQIKTILNENVRIMRSKKNASVLLPDNFIHNMSENMKGIAYNSAKYLAIVPYIQDIFVGVLAIPENNIMMAIGQISQNFYLFFDNCFEIPYSLCCNQIIYLKLELVKQFTRSVSLRKHQSYQNQLEIRSIKTQLICRKCKGQIIYFYGEDLLTKFDRYSPQRVKKDIQEQDQRRKFSIGIMVGSGRHKSYRIDDTKKYQSCLSRKFNPESIFTTNLYDPTTKRSGYQAISHKTTTLSQPKTLRNDFYQLFNQ